MSTVPATATRTVFRGGHVHARVSGGSPRPTALCVEGDVVVWVGDDTGAQRYADAADRVVELEGRLVAPAFVDAHVHLSQTGLGQRSVDFADLPHLVAALDALATHVAADDSPVVLGLNWDESRWPDQRPFTRQEVDRAVDGRPAYLARVDAHSAVVSTAFLERCPGVRDVQGYHPDGLLTRQANIVARDTIFGLLSESSLQRAVADALGAAAAHGIGMVHEMGAPGDSPAADFARIATARETAVLPETVGYWGELGAVARTRELGCAGAAGDLCADGAIGSRTSALHAPYADHETVGHLYLDADQVCDHVVVCTRAGLQAGFHCIGDRAVGTVLAGFRRAAELVGRPAMVAARHRLEHVEMASPDDIATMAELGLTASMQPMFDEMWGGPEALYARRLGDRAVSMNAFGAMQRAGVALAFGSDSPVTPFDPWGGVRAAVGHRTEQERLSVGAAFAAFTRGGWRAARRDEGGVLSPGSPATLAVWDVPGELVGERDSSARSGAELVLPDLSPGLPLPTCVATLVRGDTAHDPEGLLR